MTGADTDHRKVGLKNRGKFGRLMAVLFAFAMGIMMQFTTACGNDGDAEPVGQACEKTEDCPAGEVCSDNVCKVPGIPGDQGPEGEQGETGEAGPQGEDGADGTDGQNGTPGQNGQDGEDGTDGTDGAPGRDGQDGAPGEDGEDGEDGTSVPLCATDADCGAGFACAANGQCVYVPVECETDADCDAGFSCVDNECVPIFVPEPCDDADPCTSNDMTTVDGNCAGTAVEGCCLTDADCEDGETCLANECVPADEGVCDDGLDNDNDGDVDCDDPNCGEATNCQEGEPCDDGDPCTQDDVLDAAGNCAGEPLECGNGGECVNGQCVPVVLHTVSWCYDQLSPEEERGVVAYGIPDGDGRWDQSWDVVADQDLCFNWNVVIDVPFIWLDGTEDPSGFTGVRDVHWFGPSRAPSTIFVDGHAYAVPDYYHWYAGGPGSGYMVCLAADESMCELPAQQGCAVDADCDDGDLSTTDICDSGICRIADMVSVLCWDYDGDGDGFGDACDEQAGAGYWSPAIASPESFPSTCGSVAGMSAKPVDAVCCEADGINPVTGRVNCVGPEFDRN